MHCESPIPNERDLPNLRSPDTCLVKHTKSPRKSQTSPPCRTTHTDPHILRIQCPLQIPSYMEITLAGQFIISLGSCMCLSSEAPMFQDHCDAGSRGLVTRSCPLCSSLRCPSGKANSSWECNSSPKGNSPHPAH